MADPCCPPESAPAPEDDDAWALDTDDDPTMSMCCLRDLEEQREGERLRLKLSEVDRTMARLRMTEAVVRAPPPGEGEGAEEEGDDDIRALRERRARELRADAEARQAAAALGRGSLGQLPASDLEAILGRTPGPFIVHLATPEFAACDEVNEALESISGRVAGSQFLSVRLPRDSTLIHRWRLEGAPCLVLVYKGKPLSHATFHRFGWPESIAESSVERWVQQMLQLIAQQDQLQKKGAVAGPAKSKPAGSGRRGSDSGGSSSEEEEEDGEPCEVCGRRYPHQHVKAVYRSGYNDASDED